MKKETLIGIGIVAALGAVAFYVYKNRDTLFPAAQSTVVQSAPASPQVSLAAMTTSYTPTPIGAVNVGQVDRSPPGVNPESITAQQPTGLNGDATAEEEPVRPRKRGKSDELAEVNGNADLPTPPPAGPTGNAKLVDDAYMAIFGRHAEAAGADFWVKQMEAGHVTADSLVRDLTQGAQGSDLWNEVVIAPEAVIAYRNR